MSYTPANLDVFNAAFFGSQAGMVNYLRANTNSSASTFTSITAAAGAIAQELDTLRGAGATDDYELGLIASAAIGVVAGAANLNVTPSTYQSIAQSILAVVTSGENYLASQGITPPSPGFGPVSGPATSTVGAVSLWADSVGSNLANSTVIVTSGAGKTTMQLGAPDASYVGLQSLSGTSSYTLAFPTAQPSANQILMASAVIGGVSTLSWASAGSVTLVGDVVGPINANTLVAITGSGGTLPIQAGASTLQWQANVTAPSISQAISATGIGQNLIIRSQAAQISSSQYGGSIEFIAGKPDVVSTLAQEIWFGCETVAGSTFLRTLGVATPTALNGGVELHISDNSPLNILWQVNATSGSPGGFVVTAQQGGAGASTGGPISLTAGASFATALGGTASLSGGLNNTGVRGGPVMLSGGQGTGGAAGGHVYVQPGAGVSGGAIIFNASSGTQTLQYDDTNRFNWSASATSVGSGQLQSTGATATHRVERCQAANASSNASTNFDIVAGKSDGTGTANINLCAELVANGSYGAGVIFQTDGNGGAQSMMIQNNSDFTIGYSSNSATPGTMQIAGQTNNGITTPYTGLQLYAGSNTGGSNVAPQLDLLGGDGVTPALRFDNINNQALFGHQLMGLLTANGPFTLSLNNIDLTGVSGNYTLSAGNASFPVLAIYGTPTGNVSIILPSVPGAFYIIQVTVIGGFTVDVEASGGVAPQTIANNTTRIAVCVPTSGPNEYFLVD